MMNTDAQKIVLPNHSEQLARLREAVRAICIEQGMASSNLSNLVLAIDEVTANIMEHSTQDLSKPIEISIRFDNEHVVAEIVDEGEEFNPTEQAIYSPTPTTRSKRGFGLYLIQVISEKVDYERVEGKNVLRLIVRKQ